jgi:hypothetical protein
MATQPLPAFPTYRRHPHADARIQSALTAASVILAADILPEHKRELLSICLWKLSLAEGAGKYQTRFLSPGTIGKPPTLLAHEHVHERARRTHAQMQGETTIDSLRSLVFACTVLREEHARLTALGKTSPGVEGWDRYRRAGIAVIDRQQGTWLIEP